MSDAESLTIRPATIEDAEPIGLMVDEFRSYLRALGDLEACIHFGSEQYRRDGFGDNPAFAGLIAEFGKEVAGYALYSFDYSTDTGSRTMFLHDLFVRGVHRGAGVGDALMTRLKEICKSAGIYSMSWLVWHTNTSAIRFYEKLGAQRLETVHLMRLQV